MANLSETISHNLPCAAAKSHLRHVGTHAQNHMYIFNENMYQLHFCLFNDGVVKQMEGPW